MVLEELRIDQLTLKIYPTRASMGAAAGNAVAGKMRELLKNQASVRMIFAAAPSQNEFLDTLCQAPDIDWSRVTAFHMDDYPGLPDSAPQRFSSYLKEHIFDRVHPGQVHYLINPGSPLGQKVPVTKIAEAIEQSCENYAKLLCEQPIDIVCMGIGENGHIAFNDPPVADFNDTRWVKWVELDQTCREQQVHDGCFPTLADVPTHALTLTIPALISAKWIYCMVPGSTKSKAVYGTVTEEIAPACPATILRRHEHAQLYLDSDSASLLGNLPAIDA